MQRIVIFNTAWMTHYRGITAADQPMNGGEYVKDTDSGGEVQNFKPIRGHCFAYVRTPHGGRMNLERLGGNPGADSVSNVTVVFTATRPGGGRVVTGWYRRATVFRERQKGQGAGYFAKAEANDCTLLEPDERAFPVPRAKDGGWGIGQSNVRYVDAEKPTRTVRDLLRYLRNRHLQLAPSAKDKARSPRSNIPRQDDPVLRAKVEKAAVRHVTRHYEKQGYRCRSVEKQNLGWDLDAVRGAVKLLIEVKGCSGALPAIELTANEYDQMHRNRDIYRLAIVTRALSTRTARLSVVSFNHADETWRDERSHRAVIEEVTSARVKLKSS